MAATVAPGHDEQLSLLDMVERSLDLGSRTLGPRMIPVEIVESPVEATAEAYVTGISATKDAILVLMVLDLGLSALATLPAFEAEWLELAEGQIVPVRLDR